MSTQTFKRGKDYIELAPMLSEAESKFDAWISQANLDKEQKDNTIKAFKDLISNIYTNPESFRYEPGKGLIGNIDISQNPDGYGYAAGFLGKVIRNAKVYNNTSKPKYTSTSKLINKDLQSQIWGDNSESFRALDTNSSRVNRIARIKQGLEAYRDKIEDYWDLTEEEKSSITNQLTNAITALENNVTNDDQFILEQLGFTNVADYLGMNSQSSENPSSNLFNEWLYKSYPQPESYQTFRANRKVPKMDQSKAQTYILQFVTKSEINDDDITKFTESVINLFNGLDKKNLKSYVIPDTQTFIIPGSQYKGTIWTYNPHTLEIVRKPLWETPQGKAEIQKQWNIYQGNTSLYNQIVNNKKGGILKAQDGLSSDPLREQTISEEEVSMNQTNTNTNKLSPWVSVVEYLSKETPELIRLAKSQNINQDIYETTKDSIKPKVHNTYELYSPTVGDLSKMYFRNDLGNSILRRFAQPVTADAKLMSAREAQGQAMAEQQFAQGRYEFDQTRKQSEREALARVEDNIKRRNHFANTNMDAINDYNQTLGLLESTLKQKQFNSLDNYMSRLSSLIQSDFEENKARYNSYMLNTYNKLGETDYANNLQKLKDYYNTWKNMEGNSDKSYTDFQTTPEYKKALQRITDLYQWNQLENYSKVYSLPFNKPKTTDYLGIESDLNFNVEDFFK